MTIVNRHIGSPIERVEDLRFLRGCGEYVGDIVREGMLHAAILRSPVAHGRIQRFEAKAALAIPGVRAVLTATEVIHAIGEVPRIPLRLQASPATDPFLQPVIAVDRVRYVGEPIAVIISRQRTPCRGRDRRGFTRLRGITGRGGPTYFRK